MQIIDAQIHEPQIGGSLRPVLPDGVTLSDEMRTFVNVELAREAIDSTGIDKALVFARQPFNEACVNLYPERFAAVLVFDPLAEDLDEQMAAFRAKPGMLACRTLLTNYSQIWRDPAAELALNPAFEQGLFDRYYALAARHRLPLFVGGHDHASRIAPVAERHPDLTIIIDHFGITQSLATPVAGDRWRALPDLLALARYPNVYVKCCGVPVVSREPYPYRDVWPHFHRVLKAFGPERCMWASDYTRMRWGTSTPPDASGFPPRKDWKPYAKTLHFLLDSDEISQSDKVQLFGGAVRRALNWRD
ncbi:MAG: amidohydrolase family protein [Sphingomonas fennica]